MGKYTAKLIILWYDNYGKNQTLLQRNGMAAIPKTYKDLLHSGFEAVLYWTLPVFSLVDNFTFYFFVAKRLISHSFV